MPVATIPLVAVDAEARRNGFYQMPELRISIRREIFLAKLRERPLPRPEEKVGQQTDLIINEPSETIETHRDNLIPTHPTIAIPSPNEIYPQRTSLELRFPSGIHFRIPREFRSAIENELSRNRIALSDEFVGNSLRTQLEVSLGGSRVSRSYNVDYLSTDCEVRLRIFMNQKKIHDTYYDNTSSGYFDAIPSQAACLRQIVPFISQDIVRHTKGSRR